MLFSFAPLHTSRTVGKRYLAMGLLLVIAATFGSSVQTLANGVWANAEPEVFAAGVKNQIHLRVSYQYHVQQLETAPPSEPSQM